MCYNVFNWLPFVETEAVKKMKETVNNMISITISYFLGFIKLKYISDFCIAVLSQI